MDDGQHQVSARVLKGQNFGSASGRMLQEAGLRVIEARCEYGQDTAQTHTLTLSTRLAEKTVNREMAFEGHISLQVSDSTLILLKNVFFCVCII